jgi:hypothetical protein
VSCICIELESQGGAYLEDCEVVETQHPDVNNMEIAARLWKVSEELVGQKFDW